MEYTNEAQEHLAAMYQAAGAVDEKSKIAVLDNKLGGTGNIYASSGEVTDAQTLAILELEYLELQGFVEVAVA